MKNKLFVPLFVGIVGVCALAGAQNASAQAVIPTTDSISVISPDGSQNFDVSDTGDNSWTDIVLNDEFSKFSSCNDTYVTELKGNISFGDRWRAVSQVKSTANSALAVYIAYNNTSNSGFDLSNLGDENGFMLTPTNNGAGEPYVALLSISNTGTYQLDCKNNVGNAYTMQGVDQSASWYMNSAVYYEGDQAWLYYSNFGLTNNYTEETEVPEWPGQPPVPVVPSNWTPNFSIQTGSDWLVTFSDTNFFTFDQVPFLCSDELVPALHIEIWDRSADPEVLLTTGSSSASAQWTYQFERKDTDNDYRIVGWYECGDTPVFEHSSFFDFTLTKNGSLASNLLEDCVTETFPFMDINACINNMYTVINALYFGDITVPTWSLESDCTNLHTFADWLNLEDGYQVCAMIPSSIRNVVTPFVGFMLGIVTLGFIHRRSGEFNG